MALGGPDRVFTETTAALTREVWVYGGGSSRVGFGFGMFDANNMPILSQVAPPRFRATGYGLLNFFGISCGALLTPLLGKLKDSGTPLAVSFAYCAVPALLAAVLMFILRPKERDCGAPVST